jgi:uncharacterized protein YybS (DUF2232 family)
MNDLLSAMFCLAVGSAYTISVLYAVRAAVRPVKRRVHVLRRTYYMLVLCVIAFGSYELYDLIREKIGGALFGLAGLVVMIGVFLAYLGMIAQGVGSFWLRRSANRRAA